MLEIVTLYLIIENKTKGTAMNFNSLINIMPKGSIHRIVNSFHPNKLDIKAQTIPKINPITILT